MQVAYRANNLSDAHLARHALDAAGIPASSSACRARRAANRLFAREASCTDTTRTPRTRL